MKNHVLLLILTATLSFTTSAAWGQEAPPPPPSAEQPTPSHFWEKVFTGGNFGLQFGNQTIVELAPILGYRITDKFAAGIGAKYLYYHYRDSQVSYSTNIYGGSVFARHMITDNLFAYAECEVLNLEVPRNYFYVRKNVVSVLVGGGYRQEIGERSSLNLTLLYNVNESSDSPYINPIIRIGFGIGI